MSEVPLYTPVPTVNFSRNREAGVWRVLLSLEIVESFGTRSFSLESLSRSMHLSFGFRKTAPPQNHQLIVYYC